MKNNVIRNMNNKNPQCLYLGELISSKNEQIKHNERTLRSSAFSMFFFFFFFSPRISADSPPSPDCFRSSSLLFLPTLLFFVPRGCHHRPPTAMASHAHGHVFYAASSQKRVLPISKNERKTLSRVVHKGVYTPVHKS